MRGKRTLTPIKNKCTGYGPIHGLGGVSGSDRYTVSNLMFYAQSAITVMSGRDTGARWQRTRCLTSDEYAKQNLQKGRD